MSFDQRPARAARRLPPEPIPATSSLASPPSPAPATTEEPAPKSTASLILFVIAALVGGVLTTMIFYGLIPGIGPVTLPVPQSL